MAEFVNGYEAMGRIGPCVSLFGSARTSQKTSITCRKKIAISKAGYGVITGGPWHYGSNKGAHLAVELQWD
jgi:hypothetical protein